MRPYATKEGRWRLPVRMGEVDPRYIEALLAYEDKRFRSHAGVDPVALARAIVSDIKARRIVSGGSTISMQLARLVRARTDRGLGDKIAEMVLATRVELSYDKDAILALYASHAPFGANVVGLEAASWRYFGRSPEHLSWAEACTLAVLGIFRVIENRLPSEYYAHHIVGFKRDKAMSEDMLRKAIRDFGFDISNVSSRLTDGGEIFEYRMMIKSRDRSATDKLSQFLRGLPEVVEFRISPTGD